ncbi:hypothetical protein J6590_025002 [Homalodisca vitripennis]|nr:hypothetical protein J6590_025002 [Homalodisca vitripennis]
MSQIQGQGPSELPAHKLALDSDKANPDVTSQIKGQAPRCDVTSELPAQTRLDSDQRQAQDKITSSTQPTISHLTQIQGQGPRFYVTSELPSPQTSA